VIARWRQATIAERLKADERAASVDAEREKPEEARRSAPVDAEGEAPAEPEEPAESDEPAERDESSPGAGVSDPNVGLTRPASWWRRPLLAALLFPALLLVAAGAIFTFFRTGIEEKPSLSIVRAEKDLPGIAPSPVKADVDAPPAQKAEVRVALRPASAAAGRTARPGHLTVPDFGVGRRIVARALEGRSERFAEGDVVWFSTRVLGATVGEPIHHVWLHEGRVLQSIQLELGGPDWRTHSRKTLRGVGQWAVEARDEGGRVLARATFTCEPARP
jgi:hypothetical protein